VNQSAVGRGFFNEARLTVHQRLLQMLAAEKRREVDGVYFCPHSPRSLFVP
jgi:histidinol phosphatase-like enzyme